MHLQQFPETPDAWRDDTLAGKWRQVRKARRVVNAALEVARQDKIIGASLQAAPVVLIADAGLREAVERVDMAEICITSGIEISEADPPQDAYRLDDVDGVGVIVQLAAGGKCERCWTVSEDLGSDPAHPGLCPRCTDAVGRLAGVRGA